MASDPPLNHETKHDRQLRRPGEKEYKGYPGSQTCVEKQQLLLWQLNKR